MRGLPWLAKSPPQNADEEIEEKEPIITTPVGVQ